LEADISSEFIVYRVNWLRSKARYERWIEEKKIVSTEMGCTIRDYERRRKKWEGRAEVCAIGGDEMRGHLCYALQQADMWGRFEDDARKKFGKDADI
jgi:hypothetical protein